MIDINAPLIDKIKHTKLLAKQEAKEQWDKMREIADDYYKGRTNEHTEKYMNSQAIEEVPKDNNNITKRIIDRISLVYSVEPIREFYDAKGNEVKPSDEYVEAIKYKNESMHNAEKQTNLLRLIGIKPTLREKGSKNYFEYDILVEFEPAFGTDPLVPIGISYPLAGFAEVRNDTPELWMYIDEVNYVVYNRKTNEPAPLKYQVYEDYLNPYKKVPIVWVFEETPNLSFIDIDPANDIIMMNEVVNVLGTAQNANVIYQSYGDRVLTGVDKKDFNKTKVGPNVLTYLPKEVAYNIYAPPNTLQSVTDSVKYKHKSVAMNYHLPHGFLEDDAQPESGVARQIRNQELQDDRKGDVVRCRNTEEELYEMEKIIWKVDMKKNLPETQVVDFTETMEVLTQEQQEAKDRYQLELGLITAAEIYLRENPDFAIDIEDPKLRLQEVQTEIIDRNKAMNKTETPRPSLAARLQNNLL